MKKLLLLSALLTMPMVARAQTTTNLTYRIQVETVTAGATNTVNTNWRYDAGGTKKDANRLNGVHFAYANYFTTIGTNTPLALGPWLKQQHVVLIDDYANQKQAADNAVTAAKILSLLTINSDLLTTGDLTNLAAIAAKAP